MPALFSVLFFFLTFIPNSAWADCTKEEVCELSKKLGYFAILDQCPNAGPLVKECKKVSEKPMKLLPSPKFVVNDNETITDTVNHLVWAKSGVSQKFSLKKANEFAEKSDHAGLKGWRVPTLPELRSLLQDKKVQHSGNRQGWIHPSFDDKGEYYYWTSTTCDEVSFIVDRYQKKICQKADGAAWLINFKAGGIIWHFVSSEKFYIWMVKDLE